MSKEIVATLPPSDNPQENHKLNIRKAEPAGHTLVESEDLPGGHYRVDILFIEEVTNHKAALGRLLNPVQPSGSGETRFLGWYPENKLRKTKN